MAAALVLSLASSAIAGEPKPATTATPAKATMKAATDSAGAATSPMKPAAGSAGGATMMPAMEFPDVKKLELTANPSGLRWADVQVGTGMEIKAGSAAAVQYTGWFEDGKKFDSSVGKGQPFMVQPVGKARVIAGWNEGLQGMKVGGRRILVIPGKLAYGEKGYPGVIPPNATLIFMIDAVDAKAPAAG